MSIYDFDGLENKKQQCIKQKLASKPTSSFGVISSSTSQKVLHYFLHAIWTLTWMRVKLEEIGEDDTQRERDIREL